MADLWADHVAPSLHRIQFGYRADPTDKRGNPEKENARADGMFVYGGLGGYIEIKSARGEGWNMWGWREDQRDWYHKWCVPYRIPLFIWLNMEGNARAGSKRNLQAQKYPKTAWLVPAWFMLVIHDMCIKKYGQDTLPYHARPGINKKMQADGFDAVNMFAQYELKWLGDKTWDVKPWMLLTDCANSATHTINDSIDRSE
jgi:hypothetical protein